MAENIATTTHINGKKSRNPMLDRMKGFLVIGMVLSHTLNFFPVGPPMFCVVFSTYISTMTFPGFLFVLGYVSQYAYFSKQWDYAAKRIFLGFVKSMLALYVCGIFFTLFMQKNFSLQGIINKLLLRELPAYSEFLLSFALLYLVMLLFFPLIKNMSDRTILVLCACSVAMTFFPYHLVTHPVLASLVGCENLCTFPLAQYGIYFLMGLYFCRKKIIFHKWICPLALLCTACYLSYHLILWQGPILFPATFARVLGTTGIVHVYYLLSQKSLGKRGDAALTFIGKHTLVILVAHNALLFVSNFLLK